MVPISKYGESYIDVSHEDLSPKFDLSTWVDCSFEKCCFDGADLDNAVFINCLFNDVSFYWASSFGAVFIDCKFRGCDLRGSFSQTRFIRCGVVGCNFGDDSLGGETEWRDSQSLWSVVDKGDLPVKPM